MAEPLVRVEGVCKEYGTAFASASTSEQAATPVVLFRDLSFTVATGEMLAIVGESGAGKSTLLHLIAALDHPTAGEVWVDGAALSRFTSRQRSDYRNRIIGYVWQAHYLLPEFTAAENVAMPLLARDVPQSEARREALHWLAEVGLADRAGNRAGELSGGEQQRVSLARALVTRPKLLLADEPTGNLDARTGEAIFSMLQRVHREHELTMILVTHNPSFAQRCDRVLLLHEGHLLPPAGASQRG